MEKLWIEDKMYLVDGDVATAYDAAQQEIELLHGLLHQAVNRPKGVIPDGLLEYLEHQEMTLDHLRAADKERFGN